jgi:hypothetical protein
MAFIQAKAIKVYYTKGDRKPYDVNGKPLSYLGQESIGANIATQVRFYLGEDLSESITPIVVTKRADGDRHFDILAEGTDTEVTPNQKYYYVDLSNWYAEKVGKLTLALKVYSGTVTIEDDEITASTGRIVVSDIFHIDVAYAPDASDLVPPFDPDYYEELLEALANKVERQEVIQVVNTLPTVSSADDGKWFLVRQTNGGRLYRVLGGVAVEVETEMGQLKLTPTGNGEVTTNTGQVAWEEENGTAKLGLYNDVTLHLGEDVMYYAKAQGAIVKGDVVQFAGYQGNHALIKKAVPSEINAFPKSIMGIAKQDIANNEFGYVLAFGKLENVDTKGYIGGTLIWFDSASGTGQWTNVEPTAPNAKVLLAVVVKQESSGPANNGVILVRPTFESKLDNLQNVLIASPDFGDVLRLDGTGAKWVNSNALTTAESDIDTLQSDVIGLDNTKADLTYVDSQDDDLSNRITFIETNGGIDFIKVANFASLPTSGDVRNHRLFMTTDTKQLWEWDGTQWNESSPTDLSTIEVSAEAPNDVAMNVIGDSTLTADIIRVRDGNGDVVAVVEGDGDVVLEKDLVVEGNLTVNGTTTTVNTETVAIEDNIILINSNQTGTPSPTLKGGIEIERGDSTNYQFVFDESDDRFKVGQVGSLQTVATRQDDVNMVANGVPFYNDTEKRFDTSSNITTISNNSIQLSGGGTFRSNAGLISTGGSANAYVNTATTGTTVSRNIADANHSLIVNLANASSTGNIANFQFAGANKLEITRDGFLNQNGTRFIHNAGTQNIFVGANSGSTSITGQWNTAIGASALSSLTNQQQNVGVGIFAGNASTGGSNTFVGSFSGGAINITGSSNTFVGVLSGNNASQLVSATNSTALGNGSFTDKSNQMVFGNASVSEFKFDRNTSAIVLMPQMTISSATNPPLSTERTINGTNVNATSFRLITTTSASMVDGFGTRQVFTIRDSDNVLNDVGSIGSIRSGADNSGRFVFETATTGTLTEKMTILPNGNVGIGTNAPASLLSVVVSDVPAIQVRRNSTSTNASASIGFRITTGEGVQNFAEIQGIRTNRVNNADTDLTFSTSTGGNVPTEKMRIRDDGNVGIGTNAPASLLELSHSSLNHTNGITLTNTAEWGYGSRLLFRTRLTTAGSIGNAGAIEQNYDGSPENFNMIFYTRAGSTFGERMRIRANGNVGIGTTTPNLINAGRELTISGQENGFVNIQGSQTVDGNNVAGLTFNNLVSSTNTNIASILARRSGANNSGRLIFQTNNAGTNSEKMTILPNGNVGIGTATPTNTLDINSTAIASSRENLFRAKVSDDSTSSFGVANGTITNGAFAPTLYGYTENQLPSLTFSGFVSSGSDTGSNSVITFIGRRTSSSTDPINGNFTAISTRPMFNFINNTTNLMTILANGNVGIGTTAPASLLHLENATSPTLRFTQTGWASWQLRNVASSANFELTDGSGNSALRVLGTSLNVGINETSPAGQLQVKSGATNRVPLIVDTLASHAEQIQLFRVNGASVASVGPNGFFVGSGFHNFTSFNNALIATATTGTTISRNVADANPSLIVNQVNTSSTGDIARFQFGGSTKSYVAKDGGFYKNETKLTLTEPAFTDLGSDVYKYTLTTSQIADNDVIEITKTADGDNEVIYVEVPDNSKNIRIIVHIKPDIYTGVIGGVNYAKAVGEYTKNIFLESTANTYEGDLAGTLIQLTYNVTNNPYVFVYENINGKLKCLTTTSIGVI